jgi:uncharacterized protein YukE
MADLSHVDSEKILSTASQLDGIADAIMAQMQKIVDAVAQLDKGWVSPVKAEFLSRYQRDEDAMREMVEQYREIDTGLREMAAELDKTESEITSSVSSLR